MLPSSNVCINLSCMWRHLLPISSSQQEGDDDTQRAESWLGVTRLMCSTLPRDSYHVTTNTRAGLLPSQRRSLLFTSSRVYSSTPRSLIVPSSPLLPPHPLLLRHHPLLFLNSFTCILNDPFAHFATPLAYPYLLLVITHYSLPIS